MHSQNYVLPSLSSFCARCKQLPSTAYKSLKNLHNTLPDPKLSRCGDGVCNTALGESCGTCPEDCGACKFTSQLRSCVNKNHASLTFDDGPSEFTPALLAHLKRLNVKATFFVNAYRVNDELSPSQLNLPKGWTSSSRFAQIIKQAYDEGHLIGTHTYSHEALTGGNPDIQESQRSTLPLQALRMQMLLNDITIKDIIGKAPLAFRPPYLDMNVTVLNLMESMNYIPISINTDTKDYSFQQGNLTHSTHAILNQTNNELLALNGNEGPLFLQHDLYESSVAATPMIIENLRAKKFELVPLDVCLSIPAENFYRKENASPFNKQNPPSSAPSSPSSSTLTSAPSSSLPTSTSSTTITSVSTSPPFHSSVSIFITTSVTTLSLGVVRTSTLFKTITHTRDGPASITHSPALVLQDLVTKIQTLPPIQTQVPESTSNKPSSNRGKDVGDKKQLNSSQTLPANFAFLPPTSKAFGLSCPEFILVVLESFILRAFMYFLFFS
ncbi:hypothetical protein HMI55_001563 [Coelomomyces lativittatus]|nr:hypothetical protein HMI56_003350 [Coelomomyces lativittatus]KAJ1505524.1 hypothetical protein HMI55_001563 [Coelomomyces lativittatus]